MKKIIAIIATIVICMQSAVFPAAATETNNKATRITDILKSMSIYLEKDEMDYSEDYLTRGGLASILSYFRLNKRVEGISEYSGESFYSDVPAEYITAYDIMMVTGAGYMSGYTDKTFRPDGKVKYIEALKSLIAVLGYDAAAKEAGGWPTGYQLKAGELGLLKDLNADYDKYLTKGEFSVLLWNALNTEVLTTEIDVTGDKETLLNRMNLFELKGLLNATDETALFGYDNSIKNTVRIDDALLYTEEALEDYLGQNVTVYYEYTKDDEAILRYIETNEKKTEIIKVEASDILSTTTTSRFDYKEGTKKKSSYITGTTSVIFNGRRLTYFNLEHLVPKTGSVTLIDSTGGSEFETIVIKSYADYFVSAVYNDGMVLGIAERNGRPAINLELKYADENITIKNGNKVLDTSVLKQNMLISIAADKMEIDKKSGKLAVLDTSEQYEFLISGKTEIGTISSIGAGGDEITINGNVYAVSPAIDLTNNYLTVGKNAIVYINAFGEVAKVSYFSVGETITYINEDLAVATTAPLKGELYGFIQTAYLNQDDDTVFVRIFTQDAELKNLQATKYTMLDGVRYKNTLTTKFFTDLKNASTEFRTLTSLSSINKSGYEQMVRFELDNEGKLSSIDTVVKNYNNELMEKDCFTFGATVQRKAGNDFIYSLGGTMEGEVARADDIVTFMIPYDLSQEDNYSLYTFSTDHFDLEAIHFFDMDEFRTAQACFIQGTNVEALGESDMTNMMLVTRSYKKVNLDQEVINAVEGYKIKDGSFMELEISEKVTEQQIAKVKKGDIIRWLPDGYNRAKLLEVSITSDNTGAFLNASTPYTRYYSGTRSTFGKVENIRTDRMMIRYKEDDPLTDADETYTEVCKLGKLTYVFVVNQSDGTVEKGDISMIKSILDFGEANASKVYTMNDYGQPKTMVIYN